jgi:hypothetical protein
MQLGKLATIFFFEKRAPSKESSPFPLKRKRRRRKFPRTQQKVPNGL